LKWGWLQSFAGPVAVTALVVRGILFFQLLWRLNMETNLIKPGLAEPTPRERLSQSMKSLAGEADVLLKSAQEVGQERLSAVGELVGAQLKTAHEQITQAQVTALDRAKRAAQTTDAAVHSYPYVAIGLAAGLGALTGLLMARR
jgi:ElaB/YqjD/DUF883 family membrane-anchored ribosome-binding protein